MKRTVYLIPQHQDSPVFESRAAADNWVAELLRQYNAPEDEFTREWLKIVPLELEVFVTTAPESYDDSALTLLAEGPLRVIGIPPRNLDFQVRRYASGLHFAAPYGSPEHRYYLEQLERRDLSAKETSSSKVVSVLFNRNEGWTPTKSAKWLGPSYEGADAEIMESSGGTVLEPGTYYRFAVNRRGRSYKGWRWSYGPELANWPGVHLVFAFPPGRRRRGKKRRPS